MEARVYYNNGMIEAYRIPDYVGDSSTSVQEGVGSDTHNTIDSVCRIVERFWHDSEGFWLGYEVDKPASIWVDAEGNTSKGKGAISKQALVVSESALAYVNAILVDGEQVYPEQENASEMPFDFLR